MLLGCPSESTSSTLGWRALKAAVAGATRVRSPEMTELSRTLPDSPADSVASSSSAAASSVSTVPARR